MTDRPFDVITFDCYGTLVDWRSGIVGAFSDLADAIGQPSPPGSQLLEWHAEIEPEIQRGPYRSYRAVLDDVARVMADRLGWSVPPDRGRFLSDSLARWAPFADTNDALQRLAAAGYRLGLLSNIDDDLLAETRRHLTVSFDPVVTAQGVRSYKPARPHFDEARDALGGQRWLHAAQSFFHDVVPAFHLGIPVVWVNRLAEPPAGSERPDGEVAHLAGLVEWLAAQSG